MKYKSMGFMVCFSFMVDGFEDAWLFMSVRKIELTDFNKNLEGRKRNRLIQNHFKRKTLGY